METNYVRLEQNLKKLIESQITKDHLSDMKDFLSEVHDIKFSEGDKIWNRLKESDKISPSKGYGILIEALQYVEEIRVKETADKIICNILEAYHRNCSEGRRRNKRHSLKSQTSIDENDAHRQLLAEIGRGLDAKDSYVQSMKDYLHFRHGSHFTAKDCERKFNGLSLLTTMERMDLLSRGNYQHLFEALDHIGLKKFDSSIEKVHADYIRNDSSSENHPDYPKDIPAKGYVYDLGFRARSVVEDIKRCNYVQQDKIDNRVKLPFDANLAIVLSELCFDEQTKIIRVPEVERIGIKPVPVVHLVNVRCQELPDANSLPPVCCNAKHSFAIILMTSDMTVSEKLWTEFSFFIESQESVEQIEKLWLQDVQESNDSDTFHVICYSSLVRNLSLSLQVPLRRMSQVSAF